MEEIDIRRLKRELKLKNLQINSIYEFSSSLYSSFEIDNILRVFFSTLMGQMALSRCFFIDINNDIFQRKGFKTQETDFNQLKSSLKKLDFDSLFIKTDELGESFDQLKEFLISKRISRIVNLSDKKSRKIFLGLGDKFNKIPLTDSETEFAFFIAKFSLIAIDNSLMVEKMVEQKRMEHEINIAKDIQQSLLPSEIPELENFEMSVIYQPLIEVGGDYYDILEKRDEHLPVLIADVEGKGLSAALLAASSQAIFHSLNQLYFFEPAKFISKANSLIYDFTKGNRFITLFWMLINDSCREITYVNAGHAEPLLIRKDGVSKLCTGGFLTGFVKEAEYSGDTVVLEPGEFLIAFTDGVPEVADPDGNEYGEERMIDFVNTNCEMGAKEITDELYKDIIAFSKNEKFRDDFTLIVIKAV